MSAVFVQADANQSQGLLEVDWVLSMGGESGVRAVVGFAPLHGGLNLDHYLSSLQSRPHVAGVRQVLQSMPSEQWLTPSFARSLEMVADCGLTFDACVTSFQLRDLITLVDSVPHLRVVLDHLGKPSVGSPQQPATLDADWVSSMRELGRRENVVAKLSGLPAESQGGWSSKQLTPYLDTALEAFGPQRLMFGSDWPVSGDGSRESYVDWLDFVAQWATDRVGKDDAHAIFYATASDVYGRLSGVGPSTI